MNSSLWFALDDALLFIVWPLVAAPLIYFAGRLADGFPARWAKIGGRWFGFFALLITWAPFVSTARTVLRDGVYTRTIGSIPLRVDGLSLLLVGVTLTLGTLAFLFSVPYVAGESGDEKHYALLVALVGMIAGLGCAHDLFNLWVWFEGMAIVSYLLVAFHRDRPTTLEASAKYLVQSATGSTCVLLGIALVFAQTGALNLDVIRATAAHAPVTLAAGALLVVGFGVKAALAPLHTWLPDAHAEAPSGISALLSGVVIEAGLVALLRVLAALAGVTASWGVLLMGLGAVNVLVGNLLALRQTQIKRLLAYSSLSHMGYMLLGLGIAFQSGEVAGAQGSFFHLATHGLMKGLAFLAAGALIYALGAVTHADGQTHGLLVADLAGAAQRYPLAALALSLAVLGLGGLPPLAGFMSKWQIFVAGFATHDWVIGALVLFAALNSVLSLAYYAPLVNALYRRLPSAAVQQGRALPLTMQLPLSVLAAAVVAIGIWPGLITWLTGPAAVALVTALHF